MHEKVEYINKNTFGGGIHYFARRHGVSGKGGKGGKGTMQKRGKTEKLKRGKGGTWENGKWKRQRRRKIEEKNGKPNKEIGTKILSQSTPSLW